MDFVRSHPKARVRDPQEVNRKIEKFTKDRPEHLLVIADFDYTLSRTKSETGDECCISYGVFEMDAQRRSKEDGDFFARLTEKYLPIELDATMTREQKAPFMVEWWEKSNAHILGVQYTEKDLDDIVARSTLELREGVEVMVNELNRSRVPLMIFSAGIGNIIDVCLKHKMETVPNNVHIVSNTMLFDDKGVACGFSEPMIHTYCKNGSAIERCPSLRNDTKGRYNILLLGDSLGDLHMTDGYRPNGDEINVLKIGFLNRAIDTHYEKFMEGFDIVLLDDQTMDLPIHLIRQIAAIEN